MSSNEMSTEKYTLQLPQFPCTSSSVSESKTEYSCFKMRGKLQKENEI